jgi:hypothetical protein
MKGGNMKKEHKPRKGHRVTPPKQQYPPDWVPIKAPDNLEQMFQNWIDYAEPNASTLVGLVSGLLRPKPAHRREDQNHARQRRYLGESWQRN